MKNPVSSRSIVLIGIGDDGCVGLTSRAMNALSRCTLLAGGERHLAFFPDFAGERIEIRANITDAVERIVEHSHEDNVAVLASGDPLFFGIGKRLIEAAGIEHVEVIPHPSSMQIAFARIGIPWDDAEWISLHGKTGHFVTSLKRSTKVAFFTDTNMTPDRIATRMIEYGETEWRAYVCENLEGAGERIRTFETVAELAGCTDVAPLNVVVMIRSAKNWKPFRAFGNFHEDEFEKRIPLRGLITKKEIRVFAIVSMELLRDSVVWDVGSASGSIAIEAALVADRGDIFAIEKNGESIAHCKDNLRHFGTDNVTLIEGRAPDVFSKIPEDPDAVFIGGSDGSLSEIIHAAYERLRDGGRIIITAITLETIQEAYRTFREIDAVFECIQFNIARTMPVSKYTRYVSQNPIHLFVVKKGES